MQPTLSQRVRHMVGDQFGAQIVEMNLEKAIKEARDTAGQPEAVFFDPMSMFMGFDFMNRRTGVGSQRLGFFDLRRMAMNPIIGSIIGTRINQMAAFCQPQQDPYDIGFRITKIDKNEAGDPTVMKELTEWILTAGTPQHGEDLLETFTRKFMRDSLILDQACAEIVPRRDGLPAYLVAVDSATIRKLKASLEYFQPNEDTLFYAQVLQDRVVAEFTRKQMIFGVRNPTTALVNAGYGMPELEILVRVVSTIINAEKYNAGQLTQGGTSKGIMVVKGDAPPDQMETFRRDFREAIRNAAQYWRPPVLQIGKDGDIDWVQLDRSNRDIEYSELLNFLVKQASAAFQMDPSEINWQVGAVGASTTFESSAEAKQTMSQKRGLQPLLKFLSNLLNIQVVSQLAPGYHLEFAGMERQRAEDSEIREREVKSFRTINEVRAELGLEEIEGGDTILSELFFGSPSQRAAAEAAKAGGAREPQPAQGPRKRLVDAERQLDQ